MKKDHDDLPKEINWVNIVIYLTKHNASFVGPTRARCSSKRNRLRWQELKIWPEEPKGAQSDCMKMLPVANTSTISID